MVSRPSPRSTNADLDIPVLFFTGAGSMEYAVKAINLGAYDFLSKPIEDLDLFDVKIRRAIEKRMYVLKDKAYKKNLEVDIQAKTCELAEKNLLLEQYSHELEISTVNTIMTLQTALEEKDQYTAGHTARVTAYSQQIGSVHAAAPGGTDHFEDGPANCMISASWSSTSAASRSPGP